MIYHPIRVVHYGLGSIGSNIARLMATQRGLQIVGGIDNDPQKVGRDLGEVIGLNHPLDAPVLADADELLAQTKPDIIIHATTSFLHEVYSQLRVCIQAGANVISTCEELVYPYATARVPAEELNRIAHLRGVTVVGAGVNPGFIMDVLPLFMTAPCINVRRISVTRMVDATTRTASLQQRIGAGLTIDQFRHHLAKGTVRHVGLHESLQMIADNLGWRLDQITEAIEPITATDWIQTSCLTVAPGQVAGIHQFVQGWLHRRDVIALTWQTTVGARDTHDAIMIDGTPPIDLVIRGGLHGDQATAGIILHVLPHVIAAPPGLTTVSSLPIMHFQPRPEPTIF